MRKSITKIKEFWDSQAEQYGTDSFATTPDAIVQKLEIENVGKYLTPKKHILDVGCGNGFTTIRLARKIKSTFVGLDYSGKMIQKARESLMRERPSVRKHVEFVIGDVLYLPFEKKSFDIVFSDRCLINLTTFRHQLKAAKEIHRILKRGGLYVMCENSQEGLQKLNQLRKAVRLYQISTRWHNLYINEKKFFSAIKNLFVLKGIDNFSSSYYVGSRIFNGKLAQIEGREPDYDHPINHIAAQLPPIGDYGPMKIFLLKKK